MILTLIEHFGKVPKETFVRETSKFSYARVNGGNLLGDRINLYSRMFVYVSYYKPLLAKMQCSRHSDSSCTPGCSDQFR